MSKIIFKRVSWKNFLATGNVPNEIFLDTAPNTVILGDNGAGKTSMLNAICFGLFGKSYSGMNKPQLVNTINQKDCIVEVEFEVVGVQYKILRGIKPAIFEIFRNGELINQNADVRDYQQVLEKQILGLNFRTFVQVVVLGAAGYIPFMLMPAQLRRETIEDLLDIKIFSIMSVLLKSKIAETTDKFNSIQSNLKIAKHKLEFQTEAMKKVESGYKESVGEIRKKISETELSIQTAQEKIESLTAEIAKLEEQSSDLSSLNEKLLEFKHMKKKIAKNADKVDSNIQFYQENELCPTCNQTIPSEVKKSQISGLNEKIIEYRNAAEKLSSKIIAIEEKIRFSLKLSSEISNLTRKITDQTIITKTSNQVLRGLNERLQKLDDRVDVHEGRETLHRLEKEVESLILEQETFKKVKNVQSAVGMLLKDSGMKAIIIKQYLPVLNSYINKYLNALDLFISFELDDNFNETIKSRHRDNFTYVSFSEGERARIDIAILFAWRAVAKHKNSIDTNLLILDEVFDGSTDSEGLALLTNIIYDLKDSNVFIISHRQEMADKFGNTIRFEKQQNFSVRVE